MKILKITALLGLVLFAATPSQAQVSVNVNIGSAPVWGPPVAANVEYYYLPDIDTYYDIRSTQYVYLNQGNWVRSRNLPVAYRNYDLRGGRTIIINDYHGRSPYIHHGKHAKKYYKGNHHYAKRNDYKGHNKHNNGHNKHYNNSNKHHKKDKH